MNALLLTLSFINKYYCDIEPMEDHGSIIEITENTSNPIVVNLTHPMETVIDSDELPPSFFTVPIHNESNNDDKIDYEYNAKDSFPTIQHSDTAYNKKNNRYRSSSINTNEDSDTTALVLWIVIIAMCLGFISYLVIKKLLWN